MRGRDVYAERAAVEATARIREVTGGAIDSARSVKLTQWVYERLTDSHKRADGGRARQPTSRGCGIESRNDNVRAVRASACSTAIRSAHAPLLDAIEMAPTTSRRVIAAIEAAEDAALSSVAKFGTMLDRVSADGRLRGAFVMNGAGQTGRFCSSTGAQLHNFPRLVADDPVALRARLLHARAARRQRADTL